MLPLEHTKNTGYNQAGFNAIAKVVSQPRPLREGGMPDANLYSMDGKHTFYQRGKYLYAIENGGRVFYQQGKYFYSVKGMEKLFYKNGEYLHSMDGAAKYFFR